MKRKIILTLAVLLFAVGFSVPTFACGDSDVTNGGELVDNCLKTADEETETLDSTKETASLEDEYFSADAELKSETSVFHSRFLAGNDVSSSDFVDGVAFLAGNLVNLGGSSEYGLVAGNSITISTEVEKDLFVAGNAITLDEAANVGRDLFAVGSTLLIKANLHGNVFVAGERLVLENVTIDGDLNTDFNEIIIKGKSSVAGTFKYDEATRITGLEDLSVGKNETYSTPVREVSFFSTLENKLIFLLGRILVTIVAIALAPKLVKKLYETFALKNSWKDLALGLGLLLAVPLACIFTLITIIGLPLGFVLLVVYGLVLYFSHSVTGLVVGDLLAQKLFKKEKMHDFLKAALGIVLVALLSLLPYIGGLVTAFSLCFGFGFLTRTVFKKEK